MRIAGLQRLNTAEVCDKTRRRF